MFLYENLKKKIENSKLELKKEYKYGLDFRRTFIWGITGGTMLILCIFFIVTEWPKNGFNFFTLVAIITGIMGFSFVMVLFNYKISLNIEKGKLVYKSTEIMFEEIETAVLRRSTLPGKTKRMIYIDIITKDRIQAIIPMIMSRKWEFGAVLKTLLNEKFSIE